MVSFDCGVSGAHGLLLPIGSQCSSALGFGTVPILHKVPASSQERFLLCRLSLSCGVQTGVIGLAREVVCMRDARVWRRIDSGAGQPSEAPES